MWRLALLALAGCGRLSFDPIGGSGPGDGGDGSGDGSGITSGSTELYVKASNAESPDAFGVTASISNDGATIAIGAQLEGGGSPGVNGDQLDNSLGFAGAVYVLVRTGSTWSQQAYVKASNPGGGDNMDRVALSGDGMTLITAAAGEDSGATGIDGNQADGSAIQSGAAYAFGRVGSTWSQQAYIKASNTQNLDNFGHALAVSDDGNTVAIAADSESSIATGIDGNQADNTALRAGAVYVFTRAGTTWSQQAYVKASNTNATDFFGSSLALSSDGNTLAVGARGEASAATGIGGNQADNSAAASGAVYVFTRAGAVWSQQAYIKASNTAAGDAFGSVLSIAGDGNTLAVGAPARASSTGAAYVFIRAAAVWSEQAYLQAANPDTSDQFGGAIALSRDGAALAVGAPSEDSGARGIGGDPTDNSTVNSGAVYLFQRTGSSWTSKLYVKAPNPDSGDTFGEAVALSSGGAFLVVGASGEDGSSQGIGGDAADNSADGAGAAYLVE